MLLKRVLAGEKTVDQGLRTIAAARRRAARVIKGLRRLGNTEEAIALSVRFRQVVKQMRGAEISREASCLFSELTIAMHELNVTLSRDFLP